MYTPESPANTKSRLLDIPPELRLIIYDYYFSSVELDLQMSPNNALSKKRDFHLPLLNTCKLIRKEALPDYKKQLDASREAAAARHRKQKRLHSMARYRVHFEAVTNGTAFDTGNDVGDMMREKWEVLDGAYAAEISRVVDEIRE